MSNNTAILALQKAREDVLKRRNNALKQVSSQFDEELQSLDEAIDVLRQPIKRTARVKDGTKPYTGRKRGRKPKSLSSTVYPLHGSVVAKFLFILKEANRFVSIREIAQRVKSHEPALNEVLIKNNFTKHTDKYRAKGYIHSYQVDNSKRKTVYGLPTWVNEDDEVLPGFEHDPNCFIKDALIELGELARRGANLNTHLTTINTSTNVIQPWMFTD